MWERMLTSIRSPLWAKKEVSMPQMTTIPESGKSALHAGVPIAEARAVVLLLHGRGGNASDILSLSSVLEQKDVAYLAPEAEGNSWYPYSFLAPLRQNEPALSGALQTVREYLVFLEAAGVPQERIVLAGFSQGACLSLEYAGRNPGRYGAIVALSGGRVGPLGIEWNNGGDFAGTPVFLGCSDVDFHIPLERVKQSSQYFRDHGASVIERIYPQMGHTVNDDEIRVFQQFLRTLVASSPQSSGVTENAGG